MADFTKKKKNYVKGGAKEVKFATGGSLIHIDLKVDDLQRLPISEAGYIRITISPLKAVDKFGNTHSIYENDFVPDKSKAKGQPTSSFKKDREVENRPPWAS